MTLIPPNVGVVQPPPQDTVSQNELAAAYQKAVIEMSYERKLVTA